MNIEQNLRQICKRKGLKLSDVAERMGAGQSNLISSLKGNPTISKLEDVAAALQVSVSELLTMRPDSAIGLVVIDGQTYQLSRPAAAIVQLPSFDRFDTLRSEIKEFVKNSIDKGTYASKMGLVMTTEFFTVVYDPSIDKFYLSLCYGTGNTLVRGYDKLEYCTWQENDSEDSVRWKQSDVVQEIMNDIEGAIQLKQNM